MQRTSSPIPRSHVPQRVYSSEQYSIGSHGSYDQDSVGIGSPGGGGSGGGGGVMDTSFELMSATQLRDQLRKEQYRRQESQAEVDALKNAADGLLRIDSSPIKHHHSLPSVVRSYGYQTPSNGHDSDSGISHTISGTRPTKTQYGHTPTYTDHTHLNNRPLTSSSRSRPVISSHAEQPWSISPASGAIKNVHDAMYESEQRRLVLVEKLREAHETLQIQTERLVDSESRLNDSHCTMDNISTSNQALQRKLLSLQKEREDTLAEKMETLRQRQTHESKVNELDRELKNLRYAYTSLQAEQHKRDLIVEQTSRALSLVEEENHRCQQTKESMLKEAIALRESLQMSKTKCDQLETVAIDLDQVRQDREVLVARNSELNVHTQDCKRRNDELENENELLKGDFHQAREERATYQNRAIQLEEKCADLNAKCVSSAATKEKLLQEKLDLQQLLNQVTNEREQVNKARQLLDNQITDMQLEVTHAKLAVETKEEEMDKMTEELNAVKKVSEVLSSELSNAKQNVEKLQEDMREVTSDKRTAQQQHTYWEDEAKRLSSEKEALNKTLEQQREEFNKERDQMSEQHQLNRENLKEIRMEKTKMQSRCQELETMLQRANEEIEACTTRHQEETEEWRESCDRLSGSVSRKDNDIALLTEQLQEAQEQVVQFKTELHSSHQKHEQLLEQQDDMDRLREESKRLTQEHGEDQQVIHLLEMQKNILAKNQTSNQHRQTADQLQAQVDQLKAELGLAEDRITEAKEELSRERSHGGSVISRSARSTPAPCESCQLLQEQVDKLKEMNKIFTEKIKKTGNDTTNYQAKARALSEQENRCHDLQTQIQSLNNINSLMTEKVSRLEREKRDIMQNVPAPGEVISRTEFDQLEREKIILHGDYTHLKEDHYSIKADYANLKSTFAELEALHQQLVTDQINKVKELPTRSEKDQLEGDVRRTQHENDSLQRQIELLRSQALIAENARMRAEDKIRILEKELQDMQAQMSADREKSRRASFSPDIEATLKAQLDERNYVIQQLQSDIASKNVAMENLRQGVDNRVIDKIRELEDVLQERDDLDEARRKLDQQKLALEIKMEEQRLIIEQLRDEKPRLLQDKDAEIDRLDKQKSKLEKDLRNLREQLSEKDTELLRLQMKQGSDLDNLQDETAKQIRELQSLTLRKESEIGSLQEKIYEKEDQCREFANTKNKLELELEQLQGEAARKAEHLTNIVQRQEDEISGLREDLSKKSDLLRTMKLNQDSNVGNLKDMLSETTREFNRYKDNKDREISDIRSQLSSKDEDYERKMEMKEDHIGELQRELDEVRQDRPKIKQSLNNVEQELSSVKTELQRVNGMINVKETQIQEQDRQLQMAQMKHDEAVQDRNEHRRKMQIDLDEREDAITELQRQLDIVQSETAIHQDQAGDVSKRLEERIQSKADEISTLNKQMREVKSTNRSLNEDNQIQMREIEKLRADGGGKCGKCVRVQAEKEEIHQEKESLEEENDELHQEVDRLESLLNVYSQDTKVSEVKIIEPTKKTPVKEEILSPTKRLSESARLSKSATHSPVKEEMLSPTKRLAESGRLSISTTHSPSSRRSSTNSSPATVNPMKLAAAMKRLSVKPKDAPARSVSPSPGRESRRTSSKDSGILSDRVGRPSISEVLASGNSSRRSSIASATSLDQADRARGLSPEPAANNDKDRRQSVRDMPKKPYQEQNRASLNTLEARLKSLQASSKARKASMNQDLDASPSGDAKKKQTRFVLPSSKKFDKSGKD